MEIMTKKNKISVIVPIYNSEIFIRRCINSIVNQTYNNLEIILINDGSTDKSGEICDEYAKLDNRIKVIHKINEGVSKSRNVGIDNSNGEYLFFVDSDDYIDENLFKNLIYNIKNYDIIKSSYKIIKNNKETKIGLNYDNYYREKYIREVLFGKVGGHSWGYLIKKQIINNIKFDEKTSYMEDTIFIIQLLYKVKKIKCINNSYYNHVINKRGITSSDKNVMKNIKEYIYSLNKIEKILKDEYQMNNIYFDMLNKKLRIIEAETSKISNTSEIVEVLESNDIMKIAYGSKSNNMISIRNKLYVYIILNKKRRLFQIYNKLRKTLKNLMR